MNRRRVAVFTLAVALLLTGACAADGEVDGDYGSPDVADCDADDRRRKEIPDCGRKVNGQYREWSWVAAGKTKPPAGWKASKETTSSTGGTPAPKATKAKKSTTSGGGTKSGTSKSGTSGRRR